ncbi:MAG: phosphoserine phosphatase SerB [Rhodospirillaceae bacterium]|nr:phosphoserine phosphatase SerB [Rhodospirillaceae bacterium]
MFENDTDLVLTLIAGRGRARLNDAIVTEARASLNNLGAETAPPDWLAEKKACDIAFSGLAPAQGEAAVRTAIDAMDKNGEKPIDIIAQPIIGRKKKLLVADMDSTIVTSETLDDLGAYAKKQDAIARLTQRAMKGKIGFKDALIARVEMLKGVEESALEKTMKRIRLTSGAKTLIATMKAGGAHTVLVSGGFCYFAKRVQKMAGMDAAHANTFIIKDGVLTGEVLDPVIGKDAKLQILLEKAAKYKLSLSETISIGDGANDVPMLGAAGLGIAYHAHPVANDAASARLSHADLTGALFAQGYRAEEFITP